MCATARGKAIRDATTRGSPAKKKQSIAPRENDALTFNVKARNTRNRNVASHVAAAARARPMPVDTRKGAFVACSRVMAQKIAAASAPVPANTAGSPATPSAAEV